MAVPVWRVAVQSQGLHMKVGSLSDIQRQWSAKSKLEVFGQDFRHLNQCWRAMVGAYTGRRVLGGGPRCEVGAQVPSVAPCMFRCTWAGQAPQSSQSLRNPPGEGAGSVVVTAETLQRLRWGLPGAKTVSPVQYGVPLLGPSVVGGPVPHHGCGGRAHGEGQTSQTSKASVSPPPTPAPQRGHCQGWEVSGGQGASWEHWSGAGSCRAPLPHSHNLHAS